MRFAVTPEQKKFFVRKGYIFFEALPSDRDREIAQLVYELSDLRPLRIARKEELSELPQIPHPIDVDTDCALILSLVHRWALIYNSGFPKLDDYTYDTDGTFSLILFTKRYLDVESHPTLFQ